MTQPYGQQPGQQPGGYPQGQQPGGYPQAPGYQQGMGGMPAAPQEYSQGPTQRPGATTAAAVLAFVQGGLTLITSAILMLGLAAAQDLADEAEEASAGGVDIGAALGEAWAVSIVQLIGVALLIFGGVKLMSGAAGALFPVAAGLQILLCIYWLVRGALPIVPIVLIVMPIVALVLALGSANKQWAATKR